MQWLDGSDADWTLEWLGLEEDGSVFPGYGDGGVDTLVLDIEQGFTVKHSWVTNVIKFGAGSEQRISRNELDRQSFSGVAFLGGTELRATRARLARYAAIGSVFLLALPHKGLTIRADSAGTTIPVHAAALALVDWAKPGQRCVVARRSPTTRLLTFVNVVIQSKTANTIVVDVAPGALGKIGGWIMPAKAVYLEPQQNFERYPTAVEKWQLAARCAKPIDFAPTLASLALTGVFAGLTAYARDFGPIGNTRTLQIFGIVIPGDGIVTGADGSTLYIFQDGVTTVANFLTAMVGSPYIHIVGTPANPAAVITGADNLALTALSGGAETGDVGTGAALTTYAGDGTARPVWDRRINNAATNTDGVHAMTQILDHGGVPRSFGTADQADWFRAVVLTDGDQAEEQWFELFMSTVKGCQKKFWLSTWATDLTFVSKAANTITVSTTDGSDFTAWWPRQRQDIQIVETNGTITRARITAAVDNGNGTRTLTIGVTLGSSSVEMISWLELCRFEKADDFATTHNEAGFSVGLIARVVP